MVVGITVVTSLAGSGNPSFADGEGTQASFSYPPSVIVDASGSVFVADANNQRIRKISPTGGTSSLRLQQLMQGVRCCCAGRVWFGF